MGVGLTDSKTMRTYSAQLGANRAEIKTHDMLHENNEALS